MDFFSKIFGRKGSANPLTGEWHSDLSDEKTKSTIGNVSMVFSEDGNLVYKVRAGGKITIINMVYTVEGNSIITDQPSHPQKEKTEYAFPDENTLILKFDGEATRFRKNK